MNTEHEQNQGASRHTVPTTAVVRAVNPICPMCHSEDEEPLELNTESVYECSECGEIYMAINNNGEFEFDAYIGN